MLDRDKPAFSSLLVRLGELFGKPPSQVMIEEYWASLSHYELTDLMIVKEALKSTCRRFPSIADFSEAIKQCKQSSPSFGHRPHLLDEPWTEADSRRSALWALLTKWLWSIPANCKKYTEEFKTMSYEEKEEWLLNWINEMSKDETLVENMKREARGVANG
jgi:hypothetical protein